MDYQFPGNIRELENIIERSVALETSNIILPENLVLSENMQDLEPLPAFHIPDKGIQLNDEMAHVERQWIQRALEKSKGSKTKAAELLHVTIDSLRYRIEKLGLEADQ
jgi:two-component system response regulator PilR (NtrC family)